MMLSGPAAFLGGAVKGDVSYIPLIGLISEKSPIEKSDPYGIENAHKERFATDPSRVCPARLWEHRGRSGEKCGRGRKQGCCRTLLFVHVCTAISS